MLCVSCHLLFFNPDPHPVCPLLAVCSISPRSVPQDSSVPAVSAQAGQTAAKDDQISAQQQGAEGGESRKQLSFVLENEKQQ